MSRTRASRLPARAALVASLLLTLAAPAGAASPDVTVTTSASPLQVTVGLPIAYVVNVTNNSNNTLKYVQLSGQTSPSLTYLGAVPSPACLQTAPTCDFSGLGSGQVAQAILFYQAPAQPTSVTFTAFANFDGQTTMPPASYQNTVSAPVETTVIATNQDLVTGHSFGAFRSFTTGIGPLSRTNKHGTTVVVPTNAEVTVRDLPATDPSASCAALVDGASQVSLPCFGEASSLSVGGGAAFPDGIKVTLRWDYSDLPNGMTEKKLRVVHVFDSGTLLGGKSYEIVSNQCQFVGETPQNLPCLAGPPVRLDDKDIQATILLATNGLVRGW